MELNLRELGLPAPPLPAEIRELLLFAEGFHLSATEIGFWCFELFALESMFPCGNLLGDPYGEGSGAFWVLDVSQRTGEWGPVFYVGHDPADVVLQASGLAEFLENLIERIAPSAASWRPSLRTAPRFVASSRAFKTRPIGRPGRTRYSELLRNPRHHRKEDGRWPTFETGDWEPVSRGTDSVRRP